MRCGWNNPLRTGILRVNAGLMAANMAAGARARVALVEEGRMGGECLNTGCVPSKALIRSAKLAKEGHGPERLGLTGRLEPDYAAIMARIGRVIAAIAPTIPWSATGGSVSTWSMGRPASSTVDRAGGRPASCDDGPSIDRCKSNRTRAKLCRHRGDLPILPSRSRKTTFSDAEPRCTYRFEISGLGSYGDAGPLVHLYSRKQLVGAVLGAENRSLALFHVEPILAERSDNIRLMRDQGGGLQLQLK